MRLRGFTLVAGIVLCVWPRAALAAGPRSELVFPMQVLHNHASSLVETPEGDLLVCWYRGSGERDADDAAIMGARKRRGQGAWSEPFVMADTPGLPDCNPVLFVDPRGTLWLFWATVLDNTWGGTMIKVRWSKDFGQDGPPVWAWEQVLHCRPERIEKSWWPPLGRGGLLGQRLGWMPRAHPIMLAGDRLLLGLYSDRFVCSLAAYTADWGGTWAFSEPITGPGCIQPSFVARPDGTIVALMRDNGFIDRVMMSESRDGGRTWSHARPSEIANPSSALECVALRDGRWAMACNDTPKGRWRLVVCLSDDGGASWRWKRELENFAPGSGEASYPSLIQARDGTMHCSYTLRDAAPHSTIKHVEFDQAWVRGDPP